MRLGGAAPRPRPGEVLEAAVAEVAEDSVRLAVAVGLEAVDRVVDVRVGREEVLEAVVVQVDERVAPAAARLDRGGQPRAIAHVLELALAEVAEERKAFAREGRDWRSGRPSLS
jgi:hypothetical protein